MKYLPMYRPPLPPSSASASLKDADGGSPQREYYSRALSLALSFAARTAISSSSSPPSPPLTPRILDFSNGTRVFPRPNSIDIFLADEDHTLSNSIRFTLIQEPRVTFCWYSIPHPSDARVNIRVQTTGDPASEVLKDACEDLMLVCLQVRSTFD